MLPVVDEVERSWWLRRSLCDRLETTARQNVGTLRSCVVAVFGCIRGEAVLVPGRRRQVSGDRGESWSGWT
jgi:hypothetical protein